MAEPPVPSATVVVGVDGTTANRGALRYAVEESRRSGAPLRLVHVVPDLVPLSPLMALTPGDLTDAGHAVLTHVLAEVRDLAPDLSLEAQLRHGSRPGELAAAAEEGGAGRGTVLVVGRDDRRGLERIVDGDTTTRTAARATVPVVEVPADWPAGGGSPAHGVVVAGVKSPAHADELLGAAAAAAHARAATLVVLHVWRVPSAYDDIIESRVGRQQVERGASAELEGVLAPWRDAYPGLAIEVRVAHGDAGRVLAAASRTADLLVVVRRGHGVPASVHLGGTARSVLRHATCPVMVVPPASGPAMPPLVLEAEGRLLR